MTCTEWREKYGHKSEVPVEHKKEKECKILYFNPINRNHYATGDQDLPVGSELRDFVRKLRETQGTAGDSV